MNTLIQIRRLWKPLVFALLLAWALLFPARPGPALAAAEPIAPPQPQLYIAPLPEEIQAKLPEIIIPDQALRLR